MINKSEMDKYCPRYFSKIGEVLPRCGARVSRIYPLERPTRFGDGRDSSIWSKLKAFFENRRRRRLREPQYVAPFMEFRGDPRAVICLREVLNSLKLNYPWTISGDTNDHGNIVWRLHLTQKQPAKRSFARKAKKDMEAFSNALTAILEGGADTRRKRKKVHKEQPKQLPPMPWAPPGKL